MQAHFYCGAGGIGTMTGDFNGINVLSEQWSLVLAALPYGIGIIDETGDIVYVNPACLDIMSQSVSRMIGQKIDNFLPCGVIFKELLPSRKSFSYSNSSPNGGMMTIEILPVGAEPEVRGAVLLARDDRDLKTVKEQLQWAMDKVKYLEQKLKEEKESGWNSGRMKSESLEQKIIRSIKPGKTFEKFIGMSQKVLDLLAVAAKAAKVQSTVLICGKSGTGKELVAEGIHQASSRAQEAFVRINCAAIPEALIESEMFGHEKGAFTGAVKRKIGKFEQAHQGTIFLDEIAEMEPSMQTKLLRVLQNGCFERVGGEETIRVDVRIIAATNREMEQMVKTGQFREDLYYRLNVIPIQLPSLNERKEDIPLLVDHFLKKFCHEFGKQSIGIKKAAMDVLVSYDWPGNVRELQNIMERMVALTDSSYIEMEDIPDCCYCKEKLEISADAGNIYGAIMQGELFSLAEYEKHIIKAALEKHGSYTAAGKALGITHKTVAAKAQKYGIDK
ncbi:Anaerobic nitric oxide reductase transcription regulator NorR [Sporomusa rhizae]